MELAKLILVSKGQELVGIFLLNIVLIAYVAIVETEFPCMKFVCLPAMAIWRDGNDLFPCRLFKMAGDRILVWVSVC